MAGVPFNISSDRFEEAICDQELNGSTASNPSSFLSGFEARMMEISHNPPTFEEAVSEAFDGDNAKIEVIYVGVNNVIQKRYQSLSEKREKYKLTNGEICAIISYTLECKNSVYKLINKSLGSNTNRNDIPKVCKLIYLILSGLRKLPRYILEGEGKSLYRGMKNPVPKSAEEAKGHQYYGVEQIVTWWGFTSTTLNSNVTQEFTQTSITCTVFDISGKDAWGYDISDFSEYDESEILLEPCVQVKVTSVIPIALSHVIKVIPLPRKRLIFENAIPVKSPGHVISQVLPSIVSLPPAKVSPSSEVPETSPSPSPAPVSTPSTSHSPAPSTEAKEAQKFKLPSDFCWKTCPRTVSKSNHYDLDKWDTKVAIFKGSLLSANVCTITTSNYIPKGEGVYSWEVEIVKSKEDNGSGIYIGVAPADIDQDADNFKRCGWYINCFNMGLFSGPPQNYSKKEYGPKGRNGQYVGSRDKIGVVMDMAKGVLSFVVKGDNYGPAFEGIPLEKRLMPCVILANKGDSVKLII